VSACEQQCYSVTMEFGDAALILATQLLSLERISDSDQVAHEFLDCRFVDYIGA